MEESKNKNDETKSPSNFIRTFIDEDLKAGKYQKVLTRFPPEPNGYLHIGHAKSICLNFGLAESYETVCNLRFDDTNPIKEEDEYVRAIKRDVKWLGFDWGDREYYASDYFDQLHEYAIQLIKAGKAYVEDLNADQIREYRGTLTKPGKNSPYRDRTIDENLDLFKKMTNGELDEGSKVLRAKIDMSSPNLNMRDPVMYRILKAHHHRTGDKWCVYPMYDWAHGQSDSIEGISHSLCTLEFEDHRPLYNWFVEQLGIHPSRQIEFARLNLSYTVMSKRKLLKLVQDGHVSGWDDPRMPTIAGLRRRGYTSEALRSFSDGVGVAKANSLVDIAQLYASLREDLNKRALRVMAVLDPVKVVIENYSEGKTEELEAVNNPEDESAGKRTIPFSREIYIERADFMEDAPRKYFRLSPGKEVRLKHAYYITCTDVIKNENGEIEEIRCTYDPATRGGWSDDGRKVKGTLHWVSVEHAYDAEIRLYDHLFTSPEPDKEELEKSINPDSLQVITAKAEPGLKDALSGMYFQFLRQGYFCVDSVDSEKGKPVFNKTVGLRDSWANKSKK
ncbi:MAG: glutamine--tRNA ligase/YqeY domain fusion protein [Calditrichaeota bacterium]|nr:MAG: glutamine--tRNA ligase/YqeY domain fusion protein [Calditrichota bacterium]MBL1206946.1 glutamine--tRNA ligase/YqeY domain fusion protein [Calditrichota bacterium]NOG46773.1 glutamine--tRNA ligase/YqeY domain fusion protein [Calditrichota bacterium]